MEEMARGSMRHVPKNGSPESDFGFGGMQEAWFFTEQGSYFFHAQSDKPLVLLFQKWIAGEMMPFSEFLLLTWQNEEN
jgi:prophage antirepressor-like protein